MSTKTFSVENIPGQGRGLIATCVIKKGDEIFSEFPLVSKVNGNPDEAQGIEIPGRPLGAPGYSCCSNCWKFTENTNYDPTMVQLNVCSEDCLLDNFGDFVILKRREKALGFHPSLIAKDSKAQEPFLNTYRNILKLLTLRNNRPDLWEVILTFQSCKVKDRENLQTLNHAISKRLDDAFPLYKSWFKWLSRSLLEDVFMILSLNSHHFTIIAPDYGYTGGSGLYLEASKVNHSCDYNASFLSSFRSAEKNLIAVKDIEPGEQITISYLEDAKKMKVEERKWELARYGFECSCPSCLNDIELVDNHDVERKHYLKVNEIRNEFQREAGKAWDKLLLMTIA